MQKKKEDFSEFRLLVLIMFKEVSAPNKYEPLSPKNIFAVGKLKSKKEISIMICAISNIENSKLLLFKFINNNTEFIINKFIPNKPLKPSIKFDPLIINKKHIKVKKIEKILFFNKKFINIKSIFFIWSDNIAIKKIKDIIINPNLRFGLILTFISSRKPIKNKHEVIKKYSYKNSENNKLYIPKNIINETKLAIPPTQLTGSLWKDCGL